MTQKVSSTPLYYDSPSIKYWEDYERLSAFLTEEIIFDEGNNSTTDYPELAKKKSHYLFVYGNEKKNFKKHSNISSFPCVAVGHTALTFKMYRHEHGLQRFPILTLNDIKDGSKTTNAHIYGEIYQVSPEYIAEQDWNLGNNIACFRTKTNIQATVDANGTQMLILPWVYMHKADYWYSRLPFLKETDMLTANSNKLNYYNYMKKYEL